MTQNRLEEEYERAINRIKLFDSSYVFMKGKEQDYGNQCKELCKVIDEVYYCLE